MWGCAVSPETMAPIRCGGCSRWTKRRSHEVESGLRKRCVALKRRHAICHSSSEIETKSLTVLLPSFRSTSANYGNKAVM
jgi:hypothetical protein